MRVGGTEIPRVRASVLQELREEKKSPTFVTNAEIGSSEKNEAKLSKSFEGSVSFQVDWKQGMATGALNKCESLFEAGPKLQFSATEWEIIAQN